MSRLIINCSTGEAEEAEAVPVTVAVPQAVTPRQARLALFQAGLLSLVDDALAELPSPQKEAAQIEWEFASEILRSSPLIVSLGAALGLTDSEIDDLFIAASFIA